jgi:hypothetical protein
LLRGQVRQVAIEQREPITVPLATVRVVVVTVAPMNVAMPVAIDPVAVLVAVAVVVPADETAR